MRSVKRCIVASAIALLGSLAAPTAFGAVTIGPQLSALTTTAPSYNCSASKDCTVATTS